MSITAPPELDRVREAGAAITAITAPHADAVDAARAARDAAIVAAHQDGASTSVIAAEAGISRQRVWAIIDRDRARR